MVAVSAKQPRRRCRRGSPATDLAALNTSGKLFDGMAVVADLKACDAVVEWGYEDLVPRACEVGEFDDIDRRTVGFEVVGKWSRHVGR